MSPSDSKALRLDVFILYLGAVYAAVELFSWQGGAFALLLAGVAIHYFVRGVLWLVYSISSTEEERIEYFVHSAEN
jgi:hypothetical protein